MGPGPQRKPRPGRFFAAPHAPRRRPLRRGGAIGLGLVLAGLLGWSAVDHVVAWQSQARQRRLLARGRALYAQTCRECHGGALQGGALPDGTRVPALVKPGFRIYFRLLPAGMQGWIEGQIADGVGRMPPLGDSLDAADLDALSYLIRHRNLHGPQRR